ncbi:hypothetical protein T265_06021 [Opisthorchis viverrini]|uniref:Uncharacterized protein n=1 Tax=Opisthorchis viverrini TaxID=6198 RepID=A0A074ZTU9_OPIVI|nr:hypothetical protein T265_06021 [Opisthorchis viverrini]KER26810.1 hypothetical protein T265_06021 [Opisthorchis viverrini]
MSVSQERLTGNLGAARAGKPNAHKIGQKFWPLAGPAVRLGATTLLGSHQMRKAPDSSFSRTRTRWIKYVVRTPPLLLDFSCLGLGDLAVSQPLCFLRVAWHLGTERVLQLNDFFVLELISNACPRLDSDPGQLTREASAIPLLHHRTLEALRLKRRMRSRLEDSRVGHLSVYTILNWAWKTALPSANDG